MVVVNQLVMALCLALSSKLVDQKGRPAFRIESYLLETRLCLRNLLVHSYKVMGRSTGPIAIPK